MHYNFSRRNFIRNVGLSAGAFVIPKQWPEVNQLLKQNEVDINFYKDPTVKQAAKKLSILVLGGTRFIGPPMVQYAVERGHKVTLLNRGISNPHLFKHLKKIKADRLEGLAGIESQLDKFYDVVIDTWQDNPLAVKESAELLANRTGLYIYVSSIAVYGRANYDGQKEIFETVPLPPIDSIPKEKKETVENYRTRKQLAERWVADVYGERSCQVRFHNIVGYYMEPKSEGQMYWPVRFQRGGNILLPGDGHDMTQTIDVKDASRWLIKCAEDGRKGIYNAGRRYKWSEYAGACRALSKKECISHWIPLEKLNEQKISINTDMPMYIPRTLGPGFFNISDKKAVEQGISYRPLAHTFQDIINGFNKNYPSDYQFGPPNCDAGISLQREKEALQKMGLI